MRAFVVLLLLVFSWEAFAQEQLQFDVPFERLHLISEDFPISISFEYADVESPLLTFSIRSNHPIHSLEDHITQQETKFIFTSEATFSSAVESSTSSPASTNSANFSMLCIALLFVALFQRDRRISVVLFVMVVACYSCAQSEQDVTYSVVVQIPRKSSSPLKSLIIQGVGGGSFETNVDFPALQEIDLDFCGDVGQSFVSVENFAASQRAYVCATSLTIQGTFDNLEGEFRGIHSVVFHASNLYRGLLRVESDSYNIEGADHCSQSGNTLRCGESSGRVIIQSQDARIVIGSPFVLSDSPSSNQEPAQPSANPTASATTAPVPSSTSTQSPSGTSTQSSSSSSTQSPSGSSTQSPSSSSTQTPSSSSTQSLSGSSTQSPSSSSTQSPSSSSTQTPSSSSTQTPSSSSTQTPSSSSTQSPSGTSTQTPSSSSTQTASVSPTPALFRKSAPGEFLRAIRTDLQRGSSKENPVVARSYNGNPWEAKPDEDFPPVSFDCSYPGHCEMITEGTYIVESVSVSNNVSEHALWNRLLLQGTFGVTIDELNDIVSAYGDDYEQWIVDQIEMPAILHRTYFRERINPRRFTNSEMGTLFKPCEVGSRYHNNAFNPLDEGKSLFIHNDEVAGSLTLRIDALLRTELEDFNGISAISNVTFPLQYTICYVTDSVGGAILLDDGSGSCQIVLANPAIHFSAIDPANMEVLSTSEAHFLNVKGKADAIVLEQIITTCGIPSSNSFIQFDNEFYRFDPRVKTVRNSLEEPVQEVAEGSLTCPAVIKNFLNRDMCIQSPSCAPLTFDSTPVLLNEENLRAWYLDSRYYVYEIRDLRLESPYDVSPCSGTSRWLRLGTPSCPSPTTFSDQMTGDTLIAALENAVDTNPFVRDITLQGTNCTADANTVGAQVVAAGECFEHVHPDLHNVYDFSYWAIHHDGNAPALAAGRPNPIVRWAEEGKAYLEYPWHHPMERWNFRKENFVYVGRIGDHVPFDSLVTDLQTQAMAERVGAIAIRSEEGFEACGSPAEFENIPHLGDRYHVADPIPRDTRSHWIDTEDYYQWNAKTNVWFNVILSGDNHLRQRFAWALSQIIPVSQTQLGNSEYTESWTNYYDIFVRNAFGNYRDILREVSYNHLMTRYLSFFRNKGLTNSGTYPDENYAREIMQLFSIGLWKLNDDGTRQLDVDGNPIPTYSNEDILDFARLWTGFDVQLLRGNIEGFSETLNGIDPSQLKVDWRDPLPKAKLDSGFIGDRYPRCEQLPAHHWLKVGANYKFTGNSSEEGPTMDAELPDEAGFIGRFTPSTSSDLYQELCRPDITTGECTFPTEITLDKNLACDSVECDLQRISTVKIVDSVANVTKYYTYTSVPCVKLSFFGNGQLTAYDRTRLQCTASDQAVAVPVCCEADRLTIPVNNISNETCLITKEFMDYETARDRCLAVGLVPCTSVWVGSWKRVCVPYAFQWINATCDLKVQVYPSGRIGIVDEFAINNTHYAFDILKESSGNVFRVRWENNEYPQAATGCLPGCTTVVTLLGDTCVCDIDVNDTVVFTDVNNLPTQAEVLDRLFQGAVEPSSYETLYTLCDACSTQGYHIWTTTPGVLSGDSIFEVESILAGGRSMYLFNMESFVSIGSFEFRNPPRFMPGAGDIEYYWAEWIPRSLLHAAVEQEVEDLLDHLFEHDNTAPFVVYRLIQRLVTSNPSPRYMKTVVDAFRTGEYAGHVFSGSYGDLAATVTAILLDREARTPILEADPTFGVMREPIVRLVQALNSLAFESIEDREFTIHRSLYNMLGMEPYNAPSVFGFYLPENRPEGPLNDLGIVSPESQLAITPYLFNLLNGFMSLIDNGFTPCSFAQSSTWCNRYNVADLVQAQSTYSPDDLTNAQAVVDELDLLLTGGRVNPSFKNYIITQYNELMVNDSPEAAFKHAQKLIILSPEFHASAAHTTSDQERQPAEETPSQNRPYKAIVIVIEDGGADTFNFIVPHSNCNSSNLHAEYTAVREGAALGQNELLQITVPTGTQPCDTFGVHSAFPTIKQLYDDEEALFFANVGALIEPITKEDYFAKPLLKQLPPSLFAHNIMSRSTQNLHPQNTAAAGVLGRAVEALRNQTDPYRSEMYSLIGSVKILEGGDPDFISTGGVIQFDQYNELIDDISNITALVSGSPFAETYLSLLSNSLNQTELVGNLLNDVSLSETFPDTYFAKQLKQVAKFVHLRSQLQTERDIFVVRNGGFDTHDTFDLTPMFGTIDEGLNAFVNEMKNQSVWDSVAVLSISEFARTLTSNGAGTDHGWGGNYFLLGGSVHGGRILGQYPDQLTEEGSVHIGRGRLLPTTSWDAIWNGLLEWLNVDEQHIDEILPNLPNFPSQDLFTNADLFN